MIIGSANVEHVLGSDQHAEVAGVNIGRDVTARDVPEMGRAVGVNHAGRDYRFFGAVCVFFEGFNIWRRVTAVWFHICRSLPGLKRK